MARRSRDGGIALQAKQRLSLSWTILNTVPPFAQGSLGRFRYFAHPLYFPKKELRIDFECGTVSAEISVGFVRILMLR